MSLFRCNFNSKTLNGQVEFNVILPTEVTKDIPWILLLHGKTGDQDDWIRYSAVERYADENGFAVVMPYAGNSFYADEVYGYKYYSFITGELFDYVRAVFPLSRKREKTFVAGLSMGGYGAVKMGLNLPKRFAAIAEMSGVVDILNRFTKPGAANPEIAIRSWGEDYAKVLAPRKGSRENLLSLVEDFRDGVDKPWVFCACGTQDGLYGPNLRFLKALQDKGFTTRWAEGDDGHTWRLWDVWMDEVMKFFRERMKSLSVDL